MRKKQKEFLALYEPIHDDFERFCRARVYGYMDFRDLMNETLLKAFEKFEELRSKEAFLSYLLSISVRILANNKRKRKEESDSYELVAIRAQDANANTEKEQIRISCIKPSRNCPKNNEKALFFLKSPGLVLKKLQPFKMLRNLL